MIDPRANIPGRISVDVEFKVIRALKIRPMLEALGLTEVRVPVNV
jgi:hypothetical protein